MITLTENGFRIFKLSWHYQLRIWLIKKLAGRSGVIYNARVGGPILAKDGERVFADKVVVTDAVTGAVAYIGRTK